MQTCRRRTPSALASLAGAALVAATLSACGSGSDPTPSPTTATSSVTTPAPSDSTTPDPSPTAAPTKTSAPTPTPAPTTPVRALKKVDMVTTFAGWNATSRAVEVGGYAAVVEPVGSCTLQLALGNRVVIRKQTASKDATTVACGGFSIPRSELSAGTWKATLSYRSVTSEGAAPDVSVKVP